MMRDDIWESISSIGVVSSSSTVGAVLWECGTLEGFSETSESDFFAPLCTENPIGSTSLSMTVGSGLAISSESGEPDGIVIFFRKDSVPYSKIEKKAVNIYNILHRNEKISFEKNCYYSKNFKGV